MTDPLAVGEECDTTAHPGEVVAEAVICNQRGLHARAAARFVKLAGRFASEITVCKGGQQVSARSILGLMMLAAGPGTRLILRASGADANKAITALSRMISAGFDED